jgi:hypothetical protein
MFRDAISNRSTLDVVRDNTLAHEFFSAWLPRLLLSLSQ